MGSCTNCESSQASSVARKGSVYVGSLPHGGFFHFLYVENLPVLTWLSLGNMFPIFAYCGLVAHPHLSAKT